MTFFTIGYEHASAAMVLETLVQARVELLVDVRAVASSRRPGFSKRQLAAGLEAHGIGYLHLRELGTPKEGRLAARSGDAARMLRIYDNHLAVPDAREQLDELISLVRSGRRLCLLCYERDPRHCHRTRLAERLIERTGAGLEDLIPPLM